MVFSIRFFDKLHVDDPVGAISVHGVCGVWGTLGAALLHENLFLGLEYDLLGTLWVQAVGVVVAFVWTFGTAFILFKIVNAAIGLRVTTRGRDRRS